MATVQERPGDEAAEPSPVALLEDGPARALLSEADAEELVLAVLGKHADSLLRTARTHSLNADDAQDAYQRGLEIFLRHVRRLDPSRAHSWLHQVIKHEAMLVRKIRQRDLAPDDVDFDLRESEHASDPADALLRIDRVQRSAAALQQLKPQEVQALWLKASGHSYEEIAERQQWSRTKVICQIGPAGRAITVDGDRDRWRDGRAGDAPRSCRRHWGEPGDLCGVDVWFGGIFDEGFRKYGIRLETTH